MSTTMASLESPLSADTFAEHLSVAVDAAGDEGHDLTLVVIRGIAGRRGRARLHDALRRADAFSYEIQPGAYALLMPGATAGDGYDAATVLHDRARGGLLTSGALTHAGVAEFEPGMDAKALFDAAAAALAHAEHAAHAACIAEHVSGVAPEHATA